MEINRDPWNYQMRHEKMLDFLKLAWLTSWFSWIVCFCCVPCSMNKRWTFVSPRTIAFFEFDPICNFFGVREDDCLISELARYQHKKNNRYVQLHLLLGDGGETYQSQSNSSAAWVLALLTWAAARGSEARIQSRWHHYFQKNWNVSWCELAQAFRKDIHELLLRIEMLNDASIAEA